MKPEYSAMLHLFGVMLLLVLLVQASESMFSNENGEKSAVFLSPKFVLGAGSVCNKYYYNVDFPRGHIALKDFNAEIVDESGNSVPLYETYIHHWVILRYYAPKNIDTHEEKDSNKLHSGNMIMVRNGGICKNLGQYFGFGSETRRTATHVPDPYGIEVGNPADIPDGYEERWLINVHAIDLRGVEDQFGCAECKCNLYNVTNDEYGTPLRLGYTGGLKCCYDETQCRVREGFRKIERGVFLKYTVKWVDWAKTIVPVRIYVFDVTYTAQEGNDSETVCKIEYDVEACNRTTVGSDTMCIDNKKTSIVLPNGGYVIYGVAHQHSAGIGSALYGQDGRLICTSLPIYGNGNEAGNEAGNIVGMSTCYPQPGSVKISDGETLVLESNYSSITKHTGVMGYFYILVADQPPKPSHMPVYVREMLEYTWVLVLMGVAATLAVLVSFLRNDGKEGLYQQYLLGI
ncbi:hypothetical protein MKW94_011884 [Papaver nudicaule]|uniref:Stress up-regulated Nod 19 n=1 Tax=Papaver nudicaule TaxID=74823 RepID=A0AA41VIX5_PAPNU|nr:hypothetical protein [Papaver nudicaule]